MLLGSADYDMINGFCLTCSEPYVYHAAAIAKCPFSAGYFEHGGFFRLDIPGTGIRLVDTLAQAQLVRRHYRLTTGAIQCAPKAIK